ncbi:MAG TPA: hypothetical protein VHH73_02105, partial [Verrucomicrobiae bacterium]|nr:hypothetical protein [Verrucomicrobiae bacterium]
PPPAHGWKVENLLKDTGLLPLPMNRVMEAIFARHGMTPPDSWQQELTVLREALAGLWRPAKGDANCRRHVFIGPPGSGKSTALCQWLTQSVLLEGRLARVWRLDGRTANTAESLSVHAEILGVPVERSWPADTSGTPADIEFFDLPGVAAHDQSVLRELAGRVQQWSGAEIHLVLNGAYDSHLLLSQVRAFSALGVTDLIVTHLDEETRWGKLWNLALGTNFSLRFLCAGQNIPGDFQVATADKLLDRQFPCKKGTYDSPYRANRRVASRLLGR